MAGRDFESDHNPAKAGGIRRGFETSYGKIQACKRGGLKGDKKNPAEIALGLIKKSKPNRGRMKIADSPIPIWTKEWEKIGQFAR